MNHGDTETRRREERTDFENCQIEEAATLWPLMSWWKQRDLTFSHLFDEGKRDAGRCSIFYFSIPNGLENECGAELLAILEMGFEINLHNNLDEGLEGMTSIRKSRMSFESKDGGHGWQGNWKKIDRPAFLSLVHELAPHNRGGHMARGSAVRYPR